MPGKQDWPSRIIYGPRAPRIAQNANFSTLGPIYEKLVIIFTLVINLSALLWVLGSMYGPPQDPPNMKKVLFFHILGLNISYQIASLFCMYIDMGKRIAGKQDRFSLIIEDPLRAPKIPPKYNFCYILAHKWKTGFQIVSPCCTYVSTVMRSVVAAIWGPWYPWILCKGSTCPQIFFIFFPYFLF